MAQSHVTSRDATSALADRPTRVGVFDTVASANEAVQGLLDAGFTKEEITVISSDPAKEARFKQFEDDPAGAHSGPAALTGGAIGAALGGLTALTGVVATGGVGLLAAGAIGAWAGGAFGGLIGAMVTRGFDNEAAHFYDQSVTRGKILVAAEVHGADQQARLAEASRIIEQAGAEPLPLTEG